MSSEHAGAIVVDAELQRQRHAILRAGDRDADAGPEGGGQRDLGAGLVAGRLGRVLDQVEEHLDRAGRGWRRPAAAMDRNPRRS